MTTKTEAERRVLREFSSRPPEKILNSFAEEYMRMQNKVYPWMKQAQPKPAEKQKPQQLKLF